MKSKIWLILLTLTVVLILACSVSVTSGYFSDGESSTDNVLRIETNAYSLYDFVVLAGAGIVNTGLTTISGDVGTYPTITETGFGSVTLTGTNHWGDAVTQQAKTDLTAAYNNLASLPYTYDKSGIDLGGLTLTPGVYYFSSSAQLTGTLTLDAQNNANSEFIFQIGSTLITASASSVSLINGSKAANVYWQVGSSATLGTTTAFVGNIIALTDITLNTGAILDGRALARNGVVTLNANNISKPAP